MDKKIEVRCECEGTGFIAVADNGGDGVEHIECAQHHPALSRHAQRLFLQLVQALYLLAQRCNLLIEPRDLGLWYRFPLAIGAIKLREIAGYALVNLRQPPLHFGCVKFRSRVLTALNLLPSIATLASLNSSRRRHSTTNSRQTLRGLARR